jgi:membrane fusion protein, multidrug efflux system
MNTSKSISQEVTARPTALVGSGAIRTATSDIGNSAQSNPVSAAGKAVARTGPAGNDNSASTAPRAARRQWHRLDPKRYRLAVAMLIITAGCFLGWRWWAYASTWVKTDNAYVSGRIHQVSARVPGTVQEVLVEENQFVHAGSVLARLDRRDLEVKREQALALAAQAAARVQEAEAQIAQARATIDREQARATKAGEDLKRATQLSTTGALSQQELQAAQADAQSARAALAAAESALRSAEASAGGARAQEKVAQANLRDAELQLSYTEITAPVTGRAGKKNLESGNRVQPGQALLALVEPETWVMANFKETQLDRMEPGQSVRITVDAFPGRAFAGKVESLSPASGAQFALLPPDNATGNFTKIVQRVPVRIVFAAADMAEFASRIVPGMSTTVEVNVGTKTEGRK